MHRFLILFTHLVASLSIFLWHLWGSSMFSWVEPQKTFFPSHDQCLGGAARSLLVLGTQGTPVINQVLLLSHLALLLPKANFVLGTGLGLAQGESALGIFCLLATIQDVPVQSRQDSVEQQVEGAQSRAQTYFLCSR